MTPAPPLLEVRAGGIRCALPLEFVSETMRPLLITPVAGLPAWVLGLSRIRGVPTPVVDFGVLIGGVPSVPRRLVTVRGSLGALALGVDRVRGVWIPEPDDRASRPHRHREDGALRRAVEAVDEGLLRLLDATRLFAYATTLGPLEPTG
ncbi:MAG: chemotaxis protein CheW [Myxococcota bacterium]